MIDAPWNLADLSIEALSRQWEQRAPLDPRRIVGAYCCPAAAAMNETNCGQHPRLGLDALLGGLGLVSVAGFHREPPQLLQDRMRRAYGRG